MGPPQNPLKAGGMSCWNSLSIVDLGKAMRAGQASPQAEGYHHPQFQASGLEKEIPKDFVPKNSDSFSFIPPPGNFKMPAWATPPESSDEEPEDNEVGRPKNKK